MPANSVISQIIALPINWHEHGGFDERTASAIVHHCEGRPIARSAETGAGKSTLLFSQIATERHTVFAMDIAGTLSKPLNSPLLRKEVVEVVEGPTQKTLPAHKFDRLQLALIDGPHAYPYPELEYYYIYPHLDPGALLIIDDIHIPTINNMMRILAKDEMYDLIDTIGKTAFFERTSAPLFDPIEGYWRAQGFNANIRIVDNSAAGYVKRLIHAVKVATPAPARRIVKNILGL